MNINLNPDLLEATRLTRSGNLTEAMALLRGLSTTVKAPAASPDRGTTAKAAKTARPISGMFPPAGVGRAWTSAHFTLPRSSSGIPGGLAEGLGTKQMPEALRGFLDRVGQLGSGLDLSALDGMAKGFPGKAAVPLPEGARLEERVFANEAGSRPYKLYIPSTLGSEPVPLVVMLHGCTQSPDDFAAGIGGDPDSARWIAAVASRRFPRAVIKVASTIRVSKREGMVSLMNGRSAPVVGESL